MLSFTGESCHHLRRAGTSTIIACNDAVIPKTLDFQHSGEKDCVAGLGDCINLLGLQQ